MKQQVQQKITDNLGSIPNETLTIQDFGLDDKTFRILFHMLWTQASKELANTSYNRSTWNNIQEQLNDLGYNT